ALDVDQALTVTGTIPSTGASPYSWQWLISINGGSYAVATQCAANSGSGAAGGATETCSVASGTLTVGDTYAFELKLTDGATTPETATSGASSTLTVDPALIAPAAPSVSATALEANQALTVTGLLPSAGTLPMAWQWLISIDGGSYAASTQCAVNSGTGATGGTTETCIIAASMLTVGDSYVFELSVTDNATSAETQTSPPSPTVKVSSTLTAPPAPTPSATALVLNQALTVTGTIPTTGTSTYSWQWLISVNGGSYAATTLCAVNSGTGASGGTTEMCAIAAGTLTSGASYSFELSLTDSATSTETQTSMGSPTVKVTAPSSSSSTSLYIGIAIAAIVAAILIGLLVLRRGRILPRRAPRMEREGRPTSFSARRGPSEKGAVGPEVAPPQSEPPERIAAVSAVRRGATPAPAVVPAAAAASAEAQPDLFSLIQELEQVGIDITRKAPKKLPNTDSGDESGDITGQ
ncbi:MAG: hypothetical protein L3J95_05925, partial [Thermoplasmata archaeon]|nr:hypothetical protein [Thermoplasmata archaeon]MCI4359935.1 hypothetical protein [Thermoplasmata archaeon]